MDHFIMTAQTDELTHEIEVFEATRQSACDAREAEEREVELGDYSDFHKDVYGFRPRGAWMRRATASDFRKESRDLLRIMRIERRTEERRRENYDRFMREKREAELACAKRLTTHKEFSLGELLDF